jgi:hypothetical protein
LNNPERREAASRAIKAIQHRHGGGERGGLAVLEQAPPVEGGLSVEAERFAGELTVEGD